MMENPLDNMSSNQPKQVDKPKVAKDVKAKKSFFTVGKILAIFGVFLIIGTVVGAIIYSRSADRFKGDLPALTALNSTTLTKINSSINSSATGSTSNTADTNEVTESTLYDTQTDSTSSINSSATESTSNGTPTNFTFNTARTSDTNNVPKSVPEHPTIQIPKTLTCTAPLTKQQEESGTEYCMCPLDQYPYFTVGSGDVTHMERTLECKPFKCDPNQDELDKMYQDILSVLNSQDLAKEVVSGITAKFSAEYKEWMDASCKPKKTVEVTCEDLKNDLNTAYFDQSWEEYELAMQQLEQKKCLKPCDDDFYRIVEYVSRGQISNANERIDSYLQTCTDCNFSYGILSFYAEALSKTQQTGTAAPKPISNDDLARLKEIVRKYIENCQCLDIGMFLDAPSFPENDYFELPPVSSESFDIRTSNGLKLKTKRIRTAYAQSLAPAVTGAIQSVYDELCPPPKKEDEPKHCTTLTIDAPSSTGTYSMTGDFVPSTDYLKFHVDNSELVTGYKISSQNNTLVFDGDSGNISTNKTDVSLSGGPSVGSEDIITVTALEGGSQDLTHVDLPKETDCSAELKVVRPPENPPDKQKESVCRSLEIVSPGDAAEAGVPTIELPSGNYSNKVLEIKVDADSGSVKDYKYKSDKGYIKFNGQGTLYTTDKTVIMEGTIPDGETDSISVWARDPDSVGIQSCNDGYVITVPKEETPPPPVKDKTPPPPVKDKTPPPPVKETVIPKTPTTSMHNAAPAPMPAPVKAPSTGPGILIYLIGAGLGGTLLRKRKK